jgi:branched-chain amino acid transport system permease protein
VTSSQDIHEEVVVPPGSPERRRVFRPGVGLALGAAAVVLLACAPFVDGTIPLLLPGPLSSPGSLQLLTVILVFAALAVSYDLLFGYAGLLSAGHALFFGIGIYVTNLLMEHLQIGFVTAALIATAVATVAAVLLGALALRVRHLAFTMVTLAFAEAFWFFLRNDPARITGGDDGLPMAFEQVPAIFAGVQNAKNVFWVTLAFFVLVYVVCLVATRSMCGRVWEAIRENEERVEMLGLVPYVYKLVAFTISGALTGAAGTIFLIAAKSASPTSASVHFSLGLIVMVVIGGAGRLWGAALGAVVYSLLSLRLPALSATGIFDGLPDWASGVLSEPLFVLGLVFVLFVLFVPRGLAGVLASLPRRRSPARS